MSITVKEKEHWKERIGRRIDLAIEELESKEDPGFRKRIQQSAEERAWKSLGLDKLREEYKRLAQEVSQIDEKRAQIAAEMMKQVGSTAAPHSYRNDPPFEVQTCVSRRREVHEKELLAENPLGQKILHLQREKDELLDTVWLATSSSQIKELWGSFAKLLSWEPSELQKYALSIAPSTSDE
ncbi:hypothetical protein [Aureliella helgolandensis]|uniref:Uncharacterized protein n=1 Tax=Aureliella helgolandensis TaxID=2527968 RepID=A0A518GBQ6_9BACT|nr:hypothetical protein [Aureliella helgolandensis]QDV26051.1 hypothetical protein Q31a_44220 [Aureliella helgolandensis]